MYFNCIYVNYIHIFTNYIPLKINLYFVLFYHLELLNKYNPIKMLPKYNIYTYTK